MKTKTVALAFVFLLLVGISRSAEAQWVGPFGGYGYLYGLPGPGSTPAGSFLLGSAALTAASGQAALLGSMATVNYQGAYEHWIGNQKVRTQTYFDMRRMSTSYRAENRVASPTPELAVSYSRARLPQRLTSDQLSAESGQITWPEIFLREEFAANRTAIETWFAERSAHPYAAGRNTESAREIHRLTDHMHDTLRTLIQTIPPEEFIAGNKFLNSLAYEGRFAPDSTFASR